MNARVDQFKAQAAQLLRRPDDWQALVDQFAFLGDNSDRRNSKYYRILARRAYNIAPNKINAVFNYGRACQLAGHFQEARELFLKCFDLPRDPADASYWPYWEYRIWHSLGIAHRALGDADLAIDAYEKALALKNLPNIRKDLGIATLQSGRLSEGLKIHEIRREVAESEARERGYRDVRKRLPRKVIHWEGQPLEGKHVVVYHEEGIGDFIMMSRFIPKLRELGASKIELTGPVSSLLDFVDAQLGTDGVQPLEDGTDEPFRCDYVIGSMSLPWRIGAEYGNFDGRAYFRADKARTVPRRAALTVGLVWRGNQSYHVDVFRSMPFTEFCPLFDLPDVAFYSLQVGEPAKEITRIGFDGFVADLSPFLKTWRDTAEAIMALDVIVTVDTAVAHMAGALGKPVFVLCTHAGDWRWNRNDEKTVWYDSATMIRQSFQDDWQPCISRVREYLEKMRDERHAAFEDLRGDEGRRLSGAAS